MDLVDTNDGSGESDPHNIGAGDSPALNGRGSGGSNGGGSNPSHSQSSSAISIVHVSVPQAQVNSRRLVILPNNDIYLLFYLFNLVLNYDFLLSLGAIGDTADVRHTEYA